MTLKNADFRGFFYRYDVNRNADYTDWTDLHGFFLTTNARIFLFSRKDAKETRIFFYGNTDYTDWTDLHGFFFDHECTNFLIFN